MNLTKKYATFLALSLVSSLSFAANPCDGFEVVIKNKLSDNLLATKVDLSGAKLDPSGIHKIDSNGTQVFTVKNSNENEAMKGKFSFNTVSLPSKEANIKFDLNNKGLVCEHTDQTENGDFSIDKTRLPGKVEYTISNK